MELQIHPTDRPDAYADGLLELLIQASIPKILAAAGQK